MLQRLRAADELAVDRVLVIEVPLGVERGEELGAVRVRVRRPRHRKLTADRIRRRGIGGVQRHAVEQELLVDLQAEGKAGLGGGHRIAAALHDEMAVAFQVGDAIEAGVGVEALRDQLLDMLDRVRRHVAEELEGNRAAEALAVGGRVGGVGDVERDILALRDGGLDGRIAGRDREVARRAAAEIERHLIAGVRGHGGDVRDRRQGRQHLSLFQALDVGTMVPAFPSGLRRVTRPRSPDGPVAIKHPSPPEATCRTKHAQGAPAPCLSYRRRRSYRLKGICQEDDRGRPGTGTSCALNPHRAVLSDRVKRAWNRP